MKNADTPAMPIEINGFGQYAPECYVGLTKREMFAMHAMQGLLSCSATCRISRAALAADAIAHADALLALLESTK